LIVARRVLPCSALFCGAWLLLCPARIRAPRAGGCACPLGAARAAGNACLLFHAAVQLPAFDCQRMHAARPVVAGLD
jgi:hypothetical protein